MGSSDFYVDYNLEVPEVSDEFKQETEQRLRELAADHSDIVGAAVAVEKTVDTESYHVYRVRIVLYKRPHDIAVAKEAPSPMMALGDVLDILEERVRDSREELAQHDTHRDTETENVYYGLTADEIYATYAKGWQPEDVLKMDHDEIASRLMVEQGLPQDAADFAADQILLVAERINDQEG